MESATSAPVVAVAVIFEVGRFAGGATIEPIAVAAVVIGETVVVVERTLGTVVIEPSTVDAVIVLSRSKILIL